MSLIAKVYNVAFKRTSTYFLVLVVGAFIFERTFDMNTQKIFKYINRGKLWDDIKHNYIKDQE